MPNFTDNRVDRAYESFDAVDVHFACRLNEIECPASTGTRLKPRSSSGTWRGTNGGGISVGSKNKPKGALVMNKEDFWDLIAQAKEGSKLKTTVKYNLIGVSNSIEPYKRQKRF